MTEESTVADATPTLSFEVFWDWLVSHPNCILRAGTPEAVVFDDDDYHWHFGPGGGGQELVQVVRGKRLVGEILVHRERIAYVQGVVGDQEAEFVFELVSAGEGEQSVAYFFVLTHGYDQRDSPSERRVH